MNNTEKILLEIVTRSPLKWWEKLEFIERHKPAVSKPVWNVLISVVYGFCIAEFTRISEAKG